MKRKRIELWTDEGFEVGAIDLLSRYEPGPVYILTTETISGTPGVFICDEPFTQEEAEAQHSDEFNEEAPEEEGSED
jgi:hypothetical protein